MRSILLTLALALMGCKTFGVEDPEPTPDAGQEAGTPAHDGGPEAGVAPAVRCGQSTCTDKQVCCVDKGGNGSCSDRCDGWTFFCADAEDCAPGLVCCVDLEITAAQTAAFKGSSCRSQCVLPGSRRSCDPTKPTECSLGKGCVSLKTIFKSVYPNYETFVCED